MALDQADKDFIEKAVKNNVRVAIATYECAPGGSIYKLVEEMLVKAFAPDGPYYKGAGVYNRFTETTYEQVDKVLKEHHL